ncbi:ATP/GTP-binding protein [Streptomyces sp. NPDC001340]
MGGAGHICHTYTAAGIQLVLINETHHLNPRTTTGTQAADPLKDPTERLPTTFIYASINLPAPLFTGTRGAQLAGRATLIDCGPSPPATDHVNPSATSSPTSKAPSTSPTTNPGTLPRHAPYLHQRTAGRIGSLTRLIRQAAITAICDGTERINKNSLGTIRLDHLAETHHRPTRTR